MRNRRAQRIAALRLTIRSPGTGLDYAVNRHYDPRQGRFTQVDPIGMGGSSPSDPQSLNLYAYCGNDPVNSIDPSGLFWGKLKRFFVKAIGILNAVFQTVLAILNPNPATIGGMIHAWFDVFGGWRRILGKNAPGWLTFALSSGGPGSGVGFQIRGTPPWNPDARTGVPSTFGFQDQRPTYTCQHPPDCQNDIPPLPMEVVNVPSPVSRSIWGKILGGIGRVIMTGQALEMYSRYHSERFWSWFSRRMDEGSRVQIGVWANGEPMYMGIPIPAGTVEEEGSLLLPRNARTFGNAQAAFSHLEDYHGIDPILASERLHEIKAAWGFGPAQNVLFDRTGGVWDPATGRYLGSLTQGGARRIR